MGIISPTPHGFPGRFATNDLPSIPAVPRERDANGCCFEHSLLMNDMRPVHSRSTTALVASGVTSRGANPVPPVVKTKSAVSASSLILFWIRLMSSGTIAEPTIVYLTEDDDDASVPLSLSMHDAIASWTAGPDRSPVSYSLLKALSLTVMMATVKVSPPSGAFGGVYGGRVLVFFVDLLLVFVVVSVAVVIVVVVAVVAV